MISTVGRGISAPAATIRSRLRSGGRKAAASSRRSPPVTASTRPSPAGRPTTNMAATTPSSPTGRTTSPPFVIGSAGATRPPTPSTKRGVTPSGRWSSARSTRSVFPAPSPAELAPGMLLDFQRFASDQVAAYNRMQVEIIRAHSPGRFVTHNFMNSFTGFDHWPVAADLDFAALGFLSARPCQRGLRAARGGAALVGDLASRRRPFRP